MFLSFISKFLAQLLIIVITLTALALLISQTVVKSGYVEDQLVATNSYSRLSDALVGEIVSHADQTDPTLKDKLKTVLTPVVLQQKLDMALEQMQAYYEGNGGVPSIDVSDLVTKAQAVGVPIGSDSGIDKPITLGNEKIKGVGNTFDQAKWIGAGTAAVLAGLLALVCWKRKKWVAFPDILMAVGVILGGIAVIFTVGPGVAEHYLKFNTASNAFASVGHDLAVAIVHDLGKRLALVAISYFVVGLVVRIMLAKRHPVQKPVFLKQK